MGRSVAQAGTAELDGRADHPAPKRPYRWGDPEFYAGSCMPPEQVVEADPLCSLHGRMCHPVAAHSVRPKAVQGEPVGVEPAVAHPPEPAGFDHMDAVGGALAEEPFPVFRRRRRDRPDAPSRAVPGEPEHGRVASIDGPDCRWVVGVGRRPMRLEPAQRRVFAEMPEGERALPLIGRGRLAG
jgi:hypothetical protein